MMEQLRMKSIYRDNEWSDEVQVSGRCFIGSSEDIYSKRATPGQSTIAISNPDFHLKFTRFT